MFHKHYHKLSVKHNNNAYESNMLFQSGMKTFYAAEKWRNTPVKFWKNLWIAKLNPREKLIISEFAKLNPREKWVMIKFAKLNPREIKKFREFLSSRKFLPAKICPNKVVRNTRFGFYVCRQKQILDFRYNNSYIYYLLYSVHLKIPITIYRER